MAVDAMHGEVLVRQNDEDDAVSCSSHTDKTVYPMNGISIPLVSSEGPLQLGAGILQCIVIVPILSTMCMRLRSQSTPMHGLADQHKKDGTSQPPGGQTESLGFSVRVSGPFWQSHVGTRDPLAAVVRVSNLQEKVLF